jgi:amino acid transporter
MSADEPQINRKKVRAGLTVISAVVVIAVAMFFVVEAVAGKAVMFAIALTAFVRAGLLARSLRRL